MSEQVSRRVRGEGQSGSPSALSEGPSPDPRAPYFGSPGLVGRAQPGAHLRAKMHISAGWGQVPIRCTLARVQPAALHLPLRPRSPQWRDRQGSGARGCHPAPQRAGLPRSEPGADWSEAHLVTPRQGPHKGAPSSGEDARMFLAEWGLGLCRGFAASGPGADSDLLSVACSWYCECWYQ